MHLKSVSSEIKAKYYLIDLKDATDTPDFTVLLTESGHPGIFKANSFKKKNTSDPKIFASKSKQNWDDAKYKPLLQLNCSKINNNSIEIQKFGESNVSLGKREFLEKDVVYNWDGCKELHVHLKEDKTLVFKTLLDNKTDAFENEAFERVTFYDSFEELQESKGQLESGEGIRRFFNVKNFESPRMNKCCKRPPVVTLKNDCSNLKQLAVKKTAESLKIVASPVKTVSKVTPFSLSSTPSNNVFLTPSTKKTEMTEMNSSSRRNQFGPKVLFKPSQTAIYSVCFSNLGNIFL